MRCGSSRIMVSEKKLDSAQSEKPLELTSDPPVGVEGAQFQRTAARPGAGVCGNVQGNRRFGSLCSWRLILVRNVGILALQRETRARASDGL